jgi:hypothetical protein
MLVRDNIDIVKKIAVTLINADKEVGLERSVEKSKYMLLSHHQNGGQNQEIKKQTDHWKMCHSSDIWE